MPLQGAAGGSEDLLPLPEGVPETLAVACNDSAGNDSAGTFVLRTRTVVGAQFAEDDVARFARRNGRNPRIWQKVITVAADGVRTHFPCWHLLPRAVTHMLHRFAVHVAGWYQGSTLLLAWKPAMAKGQHAVWQADAGQTLGQWLQARMLDLEALKLLSRNAAACAWQRPRVRALFPFADLACRGSHAGHCKGPDLLSYPFACSAALPYQPLFRLVRYTALQSVQLKLCQWLSMPLCTPCSCRESCQSLVARC